MSRATEKVVAPQLHQPVKSSQDKIGSNGDVLYGIISTRSHCAKMLSAIQYRKEKVYMNTLKYECPVDDENFCERPQLAKSLANHVESGQNLDSERWLRLDDALKEKSESARVLEKLIKSNHILEELKKQGLPFHVEKYAIGLADLMRVSFFWITEAHRLHGDDFILVTHGYTPSELLSKCADHLSESSVRVVFETVVWPENGDDGEWVATVACYDYLRFVTRCVGKGLDCVLFEKQELVVEWLLAMHDLADSLQRYSDSHRTTIWSCKSEKEKLANVIYRNSRESRRLTQKIAEALKAKECKFEEAGRFKIVRVLATGDICKIIEKCGDFYEFEPRATAVLDILLKAYREKADGGWCRVKDGWRQAFPNRGANASASQFYDKLIEREMRDASEGSNMKKVAYWRIQPDDAASQDNA